MAALEEWSSRRSSRKRAKSDRIRLTGLLRSLIPMRNAFVFSAALALAASFSYLAAQQTPGQIRPRPGQGRGPEWPPPSIVDYKPKSTLVTPEHLVPKAKYPVIDIHSHQR